MNPIDSSFNDPLHNDIQFAVIGGGVIGGGWVARFLLMGFDVNVFDTDPQAKRKIEQMLNNARRSMPGLFDYLLPNEGKLNFCSNIRDAVSTANWICESIPEQLALKQSVYEEIQTYCSEDAIIASSTSGFKPSQLKATASRPEQIIVAHPFNPVYLVPLVELVGNIETTERASAIISRLGMHPLTVRKEIDAHIADRLLEAVWREGLWLVNDGIATTQEIDDVIRYGFGLRWAQMGMFETYRIAGGEAGMAHFIQQFGPALEWPWTKLMDVPELTDELIDKIASQSDEQSGQYSIKELEHIRDDNLVAIMRALKLKNWGAGNLLNQIDNQLETVAVEPKTPLTQRSSVLTVTRVVPSSWIDFNGHMNDSHYAEVFSKASDIILRRMGADPDYVARGYSYFTVDMKIDYINECRAGEKVFAFTTIKLAEGKKLDLHHEMKNAQGDICATGSQFLLHVDLNSRKSCPPLEPVASALEGLNQNNCLEAFTMHGVNIIPTPDSRYWPPSQTILSATISHKAVILLWSNNKESKLHPLWLRDNCCCEQCLNQVTREHLLDLRDIPADIEAVTVEVNTRGALCITWSHGGHRSRFNPAWLYAHIGHQSVDTPKPRLWSASDFSEPPSFYANHGQISEELLNDVLLTVSRYGFARLRDLTTDLELVEQFAQRIGPVRETHFDRIFDVVSKPDGDSNAYTSHCLAAHTDIPTRESPPGIQILHCRIAEAKGGESTMTDGFKVAKDIEQQFPEHYKTLTTTKWCYANRAGPKDYRWEAPTIGLNESGELLEIRMLPFSRAPLQASFDEVGSIYAALRCYMEKANSKEYQISFPFKAGDLIIFDNRRILHGRGEFYPQTGDRALRGTYIERDDVMSKIRQYQNQ